MSQVERVEEAGSGAGAGGAAPPAPFESLTQDDVLLALGIIARTLARRVLTAEEDAAAACAASAAWAARPPHPDDDEGCLARARRRAALAAKHAEKAAWLAPRLLATFGARATGLCRDTWRCVPAGLSAAEAARVRAGHLIWRAIIDLPCKKSRTRLMWAARKGNYACVRSLCDWHAGLGARDWFDCTALHIACRRGQADCVRELIARGADVNDSGCMITPLIIASLCRRVEAVRLLLAAGADKRRQDLLFGYVARDFTSNSAIHALLDAAP